MKRLVLIKTVVIGVIWGVVTTVGAEPTAGDDLQRRIDAAPGGVVEIDAGLYELTRTLVITNGCSLEMHKNAKIRAVRPMDVMIRIDLTVSRGRDLGVFYRGGDIDGNGLASCLAIDGFHHVTMRDMVFRNGKSFGVHVGGAEKGGCELIADNLYFMCNRRGLAGNTALKLDISDCHFTDIVIVDWTIGIDVASGGANRFTRCHVWGGAIRPKTEGGACEMLVDSVCFRESRNCCNNIFRDCYADSGKTGFECGGWETAFFGCSYYNNYSWTNLDDVTIVRQTGGTMTFDGGFFHKSSPKVKVYEGTGRVHWSNMRYSRFGKGEPRPGAVVYEADAAGASGGLSHQWVQFIFDFGDDAQVVQMTNLVATAKAHGYTGVMFASGCGLGMLPRWDESRRRRLREVKRAIDAAGLETAVGVWSFGYAKECFLPIDPNLAAAAPVNDTRYRVADGRAVWQAPAPRTLLAEPGALHSPAKADDVGARRVEVTPARSYRLRLVGRARGQAAEWPIVASVRRVGAEKDFLETRVFKLRTDGSLQTNDVFFSSLDERELTIELKGYNRVCAGEAEITALELAETEPRVVIRRHGTPLVVRNLTTGEICREGVDFAEVPRATSTWPGPWNRPFELKPLPGGRIRAGDELAVDCYASFPTWGRWTSACMAAPEAFEVMEASAAEIVRALDPKVWCLSYDEVRAGGGCADCRAIGDMAHVYAACVKRSMAIVRRVRPDAEFYLWNDMVDPHYQTDDGKNAGLYSSMKGVWDLLPPDLGIGYWTYGPREAGLAFFAAQGRPILVCAYYDEPKLARSLDWIDLARRTPGVTGIMYCTWGNHWDLLGAFGDAVSSRRPIH